MHSQKSENLLHPKYRADIDGLRAIAILSVVLYHAFPNRAPGGFIGVDVFFVISGFLISTIIFENLLRGSFSFLEFYMRRIKRIFPALILTLLASFIFGWLALLADEFQQFAKHLVAAAGFVANFVFLKESGYFDNAAETKPLLHLWSLCIEEQFYIIWPLMLWCTAKSRINFLLVTSIAAAASFAYNIANTQQNPAYIFFSPQTRFWELLIGSILAYVTLRSRQTAGGRTIGIDKTTRFIGLSERQAQVLNNALAAIGLSGILVGVLVITKANAFPGWWAILPTVGTALIIAAGSQSPINRIILANRWIVGIGLVSYPLYLWHWPILSFARIIFGEIPPAWIRGTALVISLLLAYSTYRFIEIPWRQAKLNPVVVGSLIVPMGLLAYAGYYCDAHNGMPRRTGAQPLMVNTGDIGQQDFHAYTDKTYFPCTPEEIRQEAMKFGAFTRCIQSRKGDIDFAIIGDSHAEHFIIGLAEALQPLNVVTYIKGAPPLLSNQEYKRIFQTVEQSKSIKGVIIGAAWYVRIGEVPQKTGLEAELGKTVEALVKSGKTVYLSDGAPNFPFDPSQCKYARRFSPKNNCRLKRDVYFKQHDEFYAIFKAIERTYPNVKALEIAKSFCDSEYCYMAKNGQLLFRDPSHLSIEGSRYVGKVLLQEHPELAHL